MKYRRIRISDDLFHFLPYIVINFAVLANAFFAAVINQIVCIICQYAEEEKKTPPDAITHILHTMFNLCSNSVGIFFPFEALHLLRL